MHRSSKVITKRVAPHAGGTVVGSRPLVSCALAVLVTAGSAGAAEGDVESGTAIAHYWAASPAEHAAAAEAALGSVGAMDQWRGSLVASATVELLTMFAGGAGAPQDVVKAKEAVPAAR